MPRRRGRRGKKKVTKAWYRVYAADVFPGQLIGETPAADPSKLYDRRVEVTLRDLTGDFMHEKYKLWFRIYRVEGSNAYARFDLEMLNRDYLRSIVQRRVSRIDVQVEGTTSDGHDVRYFALIITSVRVRHSQERAIRARVAEYLKSLIPELTLEELVRAAVLGDKVDINSELAKLSTKVAPIKNVEPRKIQVLRFGAREPESPLEVAAAVEGGGSGGG